MNPKRLVRCIPQGQGDCGHDHVLAGHVGRSHEIDRARALWFRPLRESEDPHNDRDDSDADQDNASGRKIALGGSEFVADMKLGGRLNDRLGRGRGRRRHRLIGHWVIVDDVGLLPSYFRNYGSGCATGQVFGSAEFSDFGYLASCEDAATMRKISFWRYSAVKPKTLFAALA